MPIQSTPLDKQLVDWLIHRVKKTVGMFEAKTKFSEICARVAETGEEYVVTKRGGRWCGSCRWGRRRQGGREFSMR